MHVDFQDIAVIVRKVLNDKLPEPQPTTPVASLDMDSLDVLEVVMGIEEKFGKDIDPTALSECATLEDVRHLVETHA